jgi:hypothetical protein
LTSSLKAAPGPNSKKKRKKKGKWDSPKCDFISGANRTWPSQECFTNGRAKGEPRECPEFGPGSALSDEVGGGGGKKFVIGNPLSRVGGSLMYF